MKVSGTFSVKLTPQELSYAGTSSLDAGRMSLDKTYEGELTGVSRGEMLSTRTPVDTSAGYVAVEIFEGSLSGRNGAFALHHYGTMTKDDQFLLINVVPDSGSGELGGLVGKMMIRIEDGQHFYDFDYSLP